MERTQGRLLQWRFLAVVIAAVLINALLRSQYMYFKLEWLGVIMPLYFSPSLIAMARQHSQWNRLFALNVLLGWTVLGWIAALVWALTKDSRSR